MAGLFEGLGAQPQQGLGFMGRAQSFREQNPGALTAIGAGLMNGNLAQGFAHAAPVIAQGRRQNATAQFLLTKGIAKTPEEAMAIAQNPALINFAMKDPDQYQMRSDAWDRYGGDPNDPAKQAYVLGLDGGGGGSEETWSVVPTYGKNAKGEDVLGVTSNRGNFRQIDTGLDFTPQGSGDKAYDRSYRSGLGKNLAEADANFRNIESKMPGLEAVVTELRDLSDKATYTGAGQILDAGISQLGMEPREAAVARTSYEAKVNNQVLPLLRSTFGAQFTEREGDTLKKTMGDTNKSPKEKQAVLDAFIEQKRRDVKAMAEEAGITGHGGSTIAPPQGGGGWTVKKVSP